MDVNAFANILHVSCSYDREDALIGNVYRQIGREIPSRGICPWIMSFSPRIKTEFTDVLNVGGCVIMLIYSKAQVNVDVLVKL